jgi:uncharacterized protein (DUF58 family)
VLAQGNIFIFPTRSGAAFLILLALLGLAALNYQNNLIYALGFLLGSLFVVSILHTFANMAGIEISGSPAEPVFCGEVLQLPVRLRSTRRRSHQQITLQFADSSHQTVDLNDAAACTAILRLKTCQRGDYHPGRLRIESVYPLGFIRCWTLIDLATSGLVYPAPLAAADSLNSGADDRQSHIDQNTGGGDFQGVRNYRSGDALRSIHWPAVAKTGRLHTRLLDPPDTVPRWLDWSLMSRTDTEGRLSQLCDLALRWHRQQLRFGLRLPGYTIEPGRGAEHQQRVLTALARFEPPMAGRAST